MPNTRQGVAEPTQSKTKPARAARKREAEPIIFQSPRSEWLMNRKELFSWYGTRFNTALAEAADQEVEDKGDAVTSNITGLTMSPMYRLLVNAYRESESKPYTTDPGWNLATFAARIYQAGFLEGLGHSERGGK